MFPYDFYEIFENFLFKEFLWMTASSERDFRTAIYLKILSNFQESVFAEHLLATSAQICRSARFEAENQFIWWSNSKIEEGTHKFSFVQLSKSGGNFIVML